MSKKLGEPFCHFCQEKSLSLSLTYISLIFLILEKINIKSHFLNRFGVKGREVSFSSWDLKSASILRCAHRAPSSPSLTVKWPHLCCLWVICVFQDPNVLPSVQASFCIGSSDGQQPLCLFN